MAESYKVGKGRPPLHSRWKKGFCPNPKGRPKGSKNFATDLEEELFDRIPIIENGRRRMITKQRAFIKRLINDAIKGDAKATASLITCALRQMVKEAAPEAQDLSAQDRQIIEEFLQRSLQPKTKGKS